MKKPIMSFAAIILLALKEKAKRVVVVLKLYGKSPLQIASDAQHYLTCMTNAATTFATPTPTLATISKLLNDVLAAVAAAKKNPGAATEHLKNAKKALMLGLKLLGSYVEDLANMVAETAVETVRLAGMEVKQDASYPKPEFIMKPGKLSGDLLMAVKAAPRQAGHDYQLSTDGINFKSAMKSNKARVTIEGLSSGTLYYGRVMRTVSKGEIQVGPILHSYVL